jgi:hypothetical protein
VETCGSDDVEIANLDQVRQKSGHQAVETREMLSDRLSRTGTLGSIPSTGRTESGSMGAVDESLEVDISETWCLFENLDCDSGVNLELVPPVSRTSGTFVTSGKSGSESINGGWRNGSPRRWREDPTLTTVSSISSRGEYPWYQLLRCCYPLIPQRQRCPTSNSCNVGVSQSQRREFSQHREPNC